MDFFPLMDEYYCVSYECLRAHVCMYVCVCDSHSLVCHGGDYVTLEDSCY